MPRAGSLESTMSVVDELEDLNERLEDNLAQIRSHATKAIKTEDDATALRKINKLLDPLHPLNKQSRDLVDSYNANLREITDDEAKDFREALQRYRVDIKNVVDKLTAKQETLQRSSLMSAGGPLTAAQTDDKTKQKIKQTEAIQEDDISRLARMNQLAGDTEKIGEHVVDELVRQEGVLETTEQDLYIIRQDIKTSRQLIKAIQKELQKDKCIRVGCFIFLAIGLILVIWAAIDPNFGGASKSAGGDGLASSIDRCQNCASGTTGSVQVPIGNDNLP